MYYSEFILKSPLLDASYLETKETIVYVIIQLIMIKISIIWYFAYRKIAVLHKRGESMSLVDLLEYSIMFVYRSYRVQLKYVLYILPPILLIIISSAFKDFFIKAGVNLAIIFLLILVYLFILVCRSVMYNAYTMDTEDYSWESFKKHMDYITWYRVYYILQYIGLALTLFIFYILLTVWITFLSSLWVFSLMNGLSILLLSAMVIGFISWPFIWSYWVSMFYEIKAEKELKAGIWSTSKDSDIHNNEIEPLDKEENSNEVEINETKVEEVKPKVNLSSMDNHKKDV